nr:unnamed protein product [Callosobruchus analis]
MTSLHDYCCICFNNILTLNQIPNIDENRVSVNQDPLSKSLQECDLSYQICDPCTNLLSIVQPFRDICFKSDIICSKQILMVQEEPKPISENNSLPKEENCVLKRKIKISESDDNADGTDYHKVQSHMVMIPKVLSTLLQNAVEKSSALTVRNVILAISLVLHLFVTAPQSIKWPRRK